MGLGSIHPFFDLVKWLGGVQVTFCQKLLFLHQLTHNMTTDCSGITLKTTSAEHGQNIDARISASEKDLPVRSAKARLAIKKSRNICFVLL